MNKLWLMILMCASATAVLARPVAPVMAMNINGVVYYGAAWQFVDMMKHSREWRAVKDEEEWSIVEDEHGWPVQLKHKNGETAAIDQERPAYMYFYGRRVEGLVTVEWDGDGEVGIQGAGYPLKEDFYPGKNKRVYKWDFKTGEPKVLIMRSNPENYVKNIRIWMPGFEDGRTVFHPEWVDMLKPFGALRFMEWNAANITVVKEWSERKSPLAMRQTRETAWEYVVQLANLMNRDPWISIPHLASDDYVRELTRFLKENLNPGLRVYVEYSNEIWNNSFSQTRWLQERAREDIETKNIADDRGRPARPWEHAAYLCGKRSAEIWRIMANEMGDPESIVRVMAHFRFLEKAMAGALDPDHGEGRVDLIAFHGYFISRRSLDYALRTGIERWSLDDGFDMLFQLTLLEDAVKWERDFAEVRANWPDIPVTCYEGGQHFANPFDVGAQGEDMLAKMMMVNRDPRIRFIYHTALEAWWLAGGSGFTAFTDVGNWSKYGCWGHKEYVRQPLQDQRDAEGNIIEPGAHKFNALLEHIERRNRRDAAADRPVIETSELPEPMLGQRYEAALRARGGTPPYRWSLFGGRLPRGLQLSEDGTIRGTPRAAEQLAFMVNCTDSAGVSMVKILGLFMSPVAESAWRTLPASRIKEAEALSGWPDSKNAPHGYAVEASFTYEERRNQHDVTGFAFNLSPDGDAEDYLRIGLRGDGNTLTVHSRYLEGSKGELWGARDFKLIPDAEDANGGRAWDPGETWTITAAVRPAQGPGAVDMILEVRDEKGTPRIVSGRADVANGRVIMREVVLKDALRSGPWRLMPSKTTCTSLRWAPLPEH